jgi:DtxR family Mn-dependent transcriptional regulator
MEMYLKAILVIEERGVPVRAKDLATQLGLSRPSVTKAVAALARDGLVSHQPYLDLALTPKGRQLARSVLRRHQVLREFFTRVLGMSPEAADEDACALEHVVSRDLLKAATDFLSFLEQCGKGPQDMVRHFQEVATSTTIPACQECGIERLVAPPLPEVETPLGRQHTRF